MTDIKVIAEITSPDLARNLSTSKFKGRISYFDKIIAVSDGVKVRTIDSLIKQGKEDAIKKVHGSKIPFFLPKHKANEFNINEKENLIVYASRFIERKNPLLFAETIAKFLNENGSWKIAILGHGPLEEKIKTYLKKYMEAGQVTVKYSNDTYGYLKRSKLFVSLIYPDNYPSQSILEAMFMKNAILATNVGNTNKLVTKENGFLVGEYKSEEVYKVLKEAVSDHERLMKMGENSSRLIEDKFSKVNYLNELQSIYESLKLL